MKNKKKRILPFVFLIVIIIIIVMVVWKNKSQTQDETDEDTSTEATVIRTDIINSLSNSSYVATALEENKELHATYYFEEIYFEKNQYISEGENIIKYTNGTYMVAPYNCVITDWSLPDENGKCTNSHYITIQSTDTMQISLSISEDELDTVYVGQEASIEIESLDNKTVTGYVTNISNSATYSSSGSEFEVDVEFQNDGEILLGMSANCSIILEKAEDVIAVPTEAISSDKGKKSVTVKTSDGQTKSVDIETGISNDAYTEVKSGLSEGDIVIIEEEESQSNDRNSMMPSGGNGGGMQDSDFEGGGGGQMPSEMPSDMPDMQSSK